MSNPADDARYEIRKSGAAAALELFRKLAEEERLRCLKPCTDITGLYHYRACISYCEGYMASREDKASREDVAKATQHLQDAENNIRRAGKCIDSRRSATQNMLDSLLGIVIYAEREVAKIKT